MPASRILVTGASGLLGSNLVLAWQNRYAVLGTYHSRRPPFDVELRPLNILKPEEVQLLLRLYRPDIVVHCAAETRVDWCEEHETEAVCSNVFGTRNLAQVCAKIGAKLVYISTDSVFDGQRGFYQEGDPVNPLNVYARTKLAGEHAVIEHCPEHLIVRTNIYGWSALPGKPSLAEWMLERLERCEVFPAWADVFFTPLLVNDLADLLGEMIDRDLTGLYHVGARSGCSKFSFADYLAKVFGLERALICAVSDSDARLVAKRPQNTALDVYKLTKALGHCLPAVRDGLVRMCQLREADYLARLRGKVHA